MQNFMLSGEHGPLRALDHAHRLMAAFDASRDHGPLLLAGRMDGDVAAAAIWSLIEDRPIVLVPDGVDSRVAETRVRFGSSTPTVPAGECDNPPWRVAMYTSGSTGPAWPYAFTIDQLDRLAGWYTDIYGVTGESALVTHLPVTYNFAFVAGVYLAATLGARLHLARSATDVFISAEALAQDHDRCVLLANPVLLARLPERPLPASVLIDSGGAPLSTSAITRYRNQVADLREGYGLTETGSLTHFDADGDEAALGTVGPAMPGVTTQIVDVGGKPHIRLTTPVLGLDLDYPSDGSGVVTTHDLGKVDDAGRLRVLGRSDDFCINGLWPRDTLDAIGPVLGTEPALIRHPTPETAHVRLRRQLEPQLNRALQATAAEVLGLRPEAVVVASSPARLLHSQKIPRHLLDPTGVPA